MITQPDKDGSDRQADRALADILLLLKDKYYIERPNFSNRKNDWDEQEAKLKEVLRELAWIDTCATF